MHKSLLPMEKELFNKFYLPNLNKKKVNNNRQKIKKHRKWINHEFVSGKIKKQAPSFTPQPGCDLSDTSVIPSEIHSVNSCTSEINSFLNFEYKNPLERNSNCEDIKLINIPLAHKPDEYIDLKLCLLNSNGGNFDCNCYQNTENFPIKNSIKQLPTPKKMDLLYILN